jgi:Kdo2-lipid IVA lauroyltransferase/acyltransferase
MSRKSLLKAFKNSAIFRALLAASAVGRRLPLPLARTAGGLLGRLAWLVLTRERRHALRHLAIAFPSLDDRERAAIGRRSFAHLGVSLFEILWLPNLDREQLESRTTFEGLEHLRAAASSGRGAVLFTGHTGNWEWMAAGIGILGFEMNVIARAIYDPRLNEFIVGSRARHGVVTIGRGSVNSAKEMLQTLRGGAILGVLIDQNIRAENADVDFFGLPAPTPIGPARLAIRAGSFAIAGFIERRGDRQHIRFEPPVATSRDDDPVELTRQMTAAIEVQIRRAPEQWVWMHQRWRRR